MRTWIYTITILLSACRTPDSEPPDDLPPSPDAGTIDASAETDGAPSPTGDAGQSEDGGALPEPDAATEQDAGSEPLVCHPDSCAEGCTCNPGSVIDCDPTDTYLGGPHKGWLVSDHGTRTCASSGIWGACESKAYVNQWDFSALPHCSTEAGDPWCRETATAGVFACRNPDTDRKIWCEKDSDCDVGWQCGLRIGAKQADGWRWPNQCVSLCPPKYDSPYGSPGDPSPPEGSGGTAGACWNGQ